MEGRGGSSSSSSGGGACSLPTAYTGLGYILGIPPRGCGDFLKENNDEHADRTSSGANGNIGPQGVTAAGVWCGKVITHNM